MLVEHAEVVKMVPTGETEHCYKAPRADVYVVTYQSANPPSGLPPTFTQREGCDSGSVGDKHEIVRVVHDDGTIKVWSDPVVSLAAAVGLSAFGFVLGFVLGFVIAALRLGWIAFRAKRRA